MDYSNNTYQPPDLASVLRTLSALAPAQGQPPAHQQPLPYQSEAPPNEDELEEGEYDPADDCSPSEPLPSPSQPPHQSHPPSPLPSTSSHIRPPAPTEPQPHTKQTHPPQPQPLPPPKSVDPATITTYPRALHHILHLTTTSSTFLPSIRNLLTTQHRHEREWHAQRLALQSRLANRAESRSKLDNVLAALGGKVSGKGSGMGGGALGQGGNEGEEGEEEKRKELERFDKKVWKAQTEMVKAMGRDLGKLGVPGFCGEAGRVLRGKVVELLEDLCGGEEGGLGDDETK